MYDQDGNKRRAVDTAYASVSERQRGIVAVRKGSSGQVIAWTESAWRKVRGWAAICAAAPVETRLCGACNKELSKMTTIETHACFKENCREPPNRLRSRAALKSMLVDDHDDDDDDEEDEDIDDEDNDEDDKDDDDENIEALSHDGKVAGVEGPAVRIGWRASARLTTSAGSVGRRSDVNDKFVADEHAVGDGRARRRRVKGGTMSGLFGRAP